MHRAHRRRLAAGAVTALLTLGAASVPGVAQEPGPLAAVGAPTITGRIEGTKGPSSTGRAASSSRAVVGAVRPASFTLAPGAAQEITITINSTNTGGGQEFGAVALTAPGRATVTLSGLDVGEHQIEVRFPGDDDMLLYEDAATVTAMLAASSEGQRRLVPVLSARWVETGRHPLRQAGSTLALACPPGP